MSITIHYTDLIQYSRNLIKRHPAVKNTLSPSDLVNEAFLKTGGSNCKGILKKEILKEILIEERRINSHAESYAVEHTKTQICIKCTESLPAYFFRSEKKETNAKEQLRNICKDCERQYFRDLYKTQRRKESVKNRSKCQIDNRVKDLSDNYISKLLREQGYIDITDTLIEEKRNKLLAKRERLRKKKAA